jgi:hypothetical protein
MGKEHDGHSPEQNHRDVRRRLRGRFTVGNIRDLTVREAWRLLGDGVRQPHREHRWADLSDVCRGCGDWQVTGAECEAEQVECTRSFWYQRTGRGDS